MLLDVGEFQVTFSLAIHLGSTTGFFFYSTIILSSHGGKAFHTDFIFQLTTYWLAILKDFVRCLLENLCNVELKNKLVVHNLDVQASQILNWTNVHLVTGCRT